jgi:hypothetical protein
LANPTDFPLHVRGQLMPVAGVHFDPSQIDHVVPRNQTDTIPLSLIADDPVISIHALNEAGLDLTLTGGYQFNGKDVELPVTQAVHLDWEHVASPAIQPIVVDGDLTEWPAGSFTMVTRPMSIKESWDWSGPADGRFRFAVQHREGKVFVAVETFDDHVITSANPAGLQDKLYIQVKTSAGVTKLEGIAGMATANASVRATPTGLIGEFAIALPPGEKTFRLNIGWMDHDRAENTKPSVLWWRDDTVAEFGVYSVEP